MSFLQLENKVFLVLGVANRKSVAYAVARTLEEEGARVVLSARTPERREDLARLLPGRPCGVCDLAREGAAEVLAADLGPAHGPFHGIVHSVAYANYAGGFKPFHETRRSDFLEAATISAFSLVEVARAFQPHLASDASVVTIGISSSVTAPTYGYMSPIKNALEGCVRFLAKSFSATSEVRFNSVNAGPLKTRSSAGIPGYLENYLYAEKMTWRRRALQTREVADAAVFLLSPRASGINGHGLVVNAGMDWNYFDADLVHLAMRPPTPAP